MFHQYRAILAFLFAVFSFTDLSHGFSGGIIATDTVIPYRREKYIINETITVQDNAILTVKPGVVLSFAENKSIVVLGYLVANGTSSSNITFRSLSDGQGGPSVSLIKSIRLVDGSVFNEGRLEVFYNGAWGTVCDDNWDEVNTEVACRELGFLRGVSSNKFGAGTGQIWMDDVDCQRTDFALKECAHLGYGVHNCGHEEDVGLICSGLRQGHLTSPKSTWLGIQFYQGSSTKHADSRSSLMNVDIRNVWQKNADLTSSSSLPAAIQCKSICPYTKNVTITRSLKAIAVSNRNVTHQEILLQDIEIVDCPYGIEVKNSTTADVFHGSTSNPGISDNRNSKSLVHLRNIKVTKCFEAIDVENSNRERIHFEDIIITGCTNGISAQFTRSENPALSLQKPSSNSRTEYPHEMNRVTISGCLTGIDIFNPSTTDISLSKMSVTNCTKGINVRDYMFARFSVRATEIVAGAYGIVYQHQQIRRLSNVVGLCEASAYKVTAPLEIRLDRNRYTGNCRKHLTAKSGDIIYIRGTATSSGVRSNLTIFDAKTFTYLYNIRLTRLNTQQISVHSAGNEVTVELDLPYDVDLELFVYTRPSKLQPPEVEFSRVTLHEMSRVAVSLSNLAHDFSITDSEAKDVFTAVSISKDVSKVETAGIIKNMTISGSNDKAISVKASYLRLEVSRSAFEIIQGCALCLGSSFNCRVSVIDDVFINNSRSINVDSFNDGNFSAINNTFASSKDGGIQFKTTQSSSIKISGNIFRRNDKYALSIARASEMDLDLSQNQFFNNTGQAIVDLNSQSASQAKANISGNTWQNNTGQSVVRLNSPATGPLSSFTDNRLLGNKIKYSYFSPSQRVVNEAAIVHVKGRFEFRQNLLENPSYPFELATQSRFQGNTIDARFNWWGTKDPDGILFRIFDFVSRNELGRVNFVPYLGSENQLGGALHRPPSFVFLDGNKLGGPVAGHVVLKKGGSPYTVTRDVIVYPNGSLSIEPGTQVNVLPHLGFLVYGKMEIAGRSDDLVRFDIGYYNNSASRRSVYPVRLVGGKTPWEGTVEVFYKNVWAAICRTGWTNVNGVTLCKQLGYQGYVGSIVPPQSRAGWVWKWLKNFQCQPGLHKDITSCPFEGLVHSCDSYSEPQAVHCDPGHWRGIQFADTAKPSRLHHVSFKRAGSYEKNSGEAVFVLQFDAQRQSLHDITITDFGSKGINFVIPNPTLTLSNIIIEKAQHSVSVGIQSRSLALSLQHSYIRMGHRSHIDHSLGITFAISSVNDKRVRHIRSVLPSVNQRRMTVDICVQNETAVGEDTFVVLSTNPRSDSTGVVCSHALRLLSEATISVFSSSNTTDSLEVSDHRGSHASGRKFSLSAPFNHVFVSGRGLVYLRYIRRYGQPADISVIAFKGQKSSPLSKGRVSLNNVTITECNKALYVKGMAFGSRDLQIERSLLTLNYQGINCENSTLDLSLKSSSLRTNDFGLHVTKSQNTLAKIENCFFSYQTDTAIFLQDNSNLSVALVGSKLENNEKLSVYRIGTFAQQFAMRNCAVQNSRREAMRVIFDAVPESLEFTIENNSFIQNYDVVLHVEQKRKSTTGNGYFFLLKNNTFTDNNSRTKSGILVVAFQGIVEIVGNTFLKNWCDFVCKFRPSGTTDVKFVDNVVEDNSPLSPQHQDTFAGRFSQFTFGIFGCVSGGFSINRNIFNNPKMGSELLVSGDYFNNGREIDARHNWWGTQDSEQIETRIFDFASEDWHYRGVVKFLPASESRDFISFTDEGSQNASFLGGFLNSSARLSLKNSPFIIDKDLTVSQDASITVDPGVTLLFRPRVGLLVLGNIFALGSSDKPIRFCSLDTKCAGERADSGSYSRVRYGYIPFADKKVLEVLVEKSWKYVCGDNFGSPNGRVVCREMGLGDVLKVSVEYCSATPTRLWQRSIKCSGSENSLLDCASSQVYCYHCVVVLCKPGTKWKNIRLASVQNATNVNKHDPSVLKNVLVDDSGFAVDDEKVSSIQISNRSPRIEHVRITRIASVGIQITSLRSSIILDSITVNNSCSSGIQIIDNEGKLVVRNSRIFGAKSGALIIAPLGSVKSTSSYFGLPSVCDCRSEIFVRDRTYIYLAGRKLDPTLRGCLKLVTSPENTYLELRILSRPKFIVYSSYIDIHDGNSAKNVILARFLTWSIFHRNVYQTSFNSVFFVASYEKLNEEFLAEITVVHKTGKNSGGNAKHNPEYVIESNQFSSYEGPAIQFTGDHDTSSKLLISQNQINSSGRNQQANERKSSIEIRGRNNDDIEISNNFIHDNFQGGIRVNTKSSRFQCKILNNVLSSNVNGSESILVEASSGISPYVLLAGNELKSNNLNQTTDLVRINNFQADVVGNVISENIMRYVLNWESVTGENKPEVCENNTFSMNAGYLQTIVLTGTKKLIKKNYIVNPANHYEMAVFPNPPVNNLSAQFDARFNWWGYQATEDVLKRITARSPQSSLPVVFFEPFLTSATEIFDKGSCPLGWTLVRRACYYYHGGAASFDVARKICKDKGSILVQVGKEDIVEQNSVRTLLRRRQFGTSKIAAVWVNVLSNEMSGDNCWCFNGSTFSNTTCGSLLPSVCRKDAEIDCPNSCFHNGVCKGRMCSCNKGYEGADCSQYHCRDVGNCGRYGTCVGPNYCKCRLGWKGRGCTVSYCPPLTTCKSCLSRKGCGWCDEQRRCLPGTAYRSDVAQCRDWFYYQCLSVGDNPRCSDQIKIIDCQTRLCNYTFEDSNKKTCQQCEELEKCFTKKVSSNQAFCRTWNETRCPQGFVLKDYSDRSRIKFTVASAKLKIVTAKAAKLYKCPTQDGSVIVSKNNALVGSSGDIISSTQAEGILHKVDNVAYTDRYQFLQGTPASLDDAVSYSDFNQEVPLQKITTQKQVDDAPDKDLLSTFSSGGVKLNGGSIHRFGNDSKVFKSVGNEYSLSGGVGNTNSIFLTMSNDAVKTPLNVGDVVVGNKSSGFLENVVQVQQDKGNTFIHSKLAKGGGTVNLGGLKKVPKRGKKCLGGDDLSSLSIVDGKASVAAGDTIIGRESGPFLGKVLKTYTDNNNVVAEVVSVVGQKNGNVLTRLDNQAGNGRRRKREVAMANPKFQYTAAKDVKSVTEHCARIADARGEEEVTAGSRAARKTGKLTSMVEGESYLLNIRGGVSFEPKAKVSLDISDFDMKSVGVVLSGNAYLFAGATLQFKENSGIKKNSLSYTLLKDKDAGAFAIELPGVGFVSGQFLLDLTLKVDLKTNTTARGSVSIDVSSPADLTMGGIWRKGLGVENIFEMKGARVSNFSDTQLQNGMASLSLVLTPTFRVKWPHSSEKQDTSWEDAPDELKDIFDIKKTGKAPSFMKVSLNAPFKAFFESAVCSERCQDPGKNIESRVRAGLAAMGGKLSLKLASFEEDWPLLSSQVFENASRICITAKNTKPCCGNTTHPGKVNPRTKQCQLVCSCDPNDPTKIGVELPNGKCECDECPIGFINCQCRDTNETQAARKCKSPICPDGSLRLKRSHGKPGCPCECADGKEREMSEDASCPCNCTCSDGTQDVIASDSSCPCICRCKGYETSTTGPGGCKCENDRCPVCQDNEVAVWVDRRCLCREKYDCGLPPVCVDGRKGPKCLQPDCGLCKGCSGNGICTTSSSCESQCVCNWFWEGECCERRIPRRVWGDPHLETLDGYGFDYFGIGEFWDCKSVANDFGIQTRFYAYKGASLTGAVAVKVGASVVTITTCSKCSSVDLPALRIDGSIESISAGKRFILANDTITLDVQKPGNDTNGNATSLMVFAFQYKSGVTVSINVGYSPKMSRQYINVQFAPIASFLRQTEGICGFMDDDSSNDLIGPNGETHSDPLLFTELWRVSTIQNASGTFGSWSWNSSNFHADDVMDESYTDASHRPVYTLDNLAKEIVDKANASCTQLGLKDSLLSNCIFDIAITNDTSFLEQQSLKLGCPNECSGKGLCDNATCSCLEGWSGRDCSIGKCGNCSRGQCEGGFCQCEVGWEGPACNLQATCYDVDNCTSPIHGKCKANNKCLCNTGFTGSNCSIKATCYNVKNCSSHGVCVGIDVCKCDLGWNGTTCEKLSCESLGHCSGNGECIAFDVCQCSNGWTGPSCAIFDCSEVNHCSKNGQCVGPNSCQCFDGYQGNNCNASLNCSSLGDCSGSGVCVLTKELKSVCSCYLGFTGSNCSQYDCSGVNDCSGKGKCVQPNLCECGEGYEGATCSNFTCEKLSRCSGRGTCVSFDQCACHTGWGGVSCDTPDCTSLLNCSGNGTCIAPNNCECYSMYDGERCDERIQTNLHSPVFSKSVYNATVVENLPIGHHVFTVYANDSDLGRSGKVNFDMIDNAVNSFFVIDRASGRISTTKKFDYEALSQNVFTFTVVAVDDGTPRRSTEATVVISVLDQNDNCPVFESIPTSYNVPLESKLKFVIVTVRAHDADGGLNGQVEYEINKETNPGRFFAIDKYDGRLFVNRTLQPGKYLLTVMARDLGDNPCRREIFLGLTVDAAIAPKSSSATTVGGSSVVSTPNQTTTLIGTKTSTPMLRVTARQTSVQTPSQLSTPTETSTQVSIQTTTQTLKQKPSQLSTLTETSTQVFTQTALQTSTWISTLASAVTQMSTQTLTDIPTRISAQSPAQMSTQTSAYTLEKTPIQASTNMTPSSMTARTRRSSIILQPSPTEGAMLTQKLSPSSSRKTTQVQKPMPVTYSASISAATTPTQTLTVASLTPSLLSTSIPKTTPVHTPALLTTLTSISSKIILVASRSQTATTVNMTVLKTTIAMSTEPTVTPTIDLTIYATKTRMLSLALSSNLSSSPTPKLTSALASVSTLASISAAQPSGEIVVTTTGTAATTINIMATKAVGSVETTTTPEKTTASTLAAATTNTMSKKPVESLQATKTAEVGAATGTASLTTNTVATRTVELLEATTRTITTTSATQAIPTTTFSYISSPSTPATLNIFAIDIRLTNIEFRLELQDSSSAAYTNYERMILDVLIPLLMKITGFESVHLKRFRRGSVIAEISVTFLSLHENVDANVVRQTIIDNVDQKGNIGSLTFDVSFLEKAVGKTTKAPVDPKDDSSPSVTMMIIIGASVLLIIISGVIWCYFWRRRVQISRHLESRKQKKNVHEPVELVPLNDEELMQNRRAASMYSELSV